MGGATAVRLRSSGVWIPALPDPASLEAGPTAPAPPRAPIPPQSTPVPSKATISPVTGQRVGGIAGAVLGESALLLVVFLSRDWLKHRRPLAAWVRRSQQVHEPVREPSADRAGLLGRAHALLTGMHGLLPVATGATRPVLVMAMLLLLWALRARDAQFPTLLCPFIGYCVR